MKSILFFSLLLLPTFLLAQKCHYEFDKVDDFTKERSVSSEFIRMFIQGRGKHAAAVMMGVSARKEEMFMSACNLGGKNLLCMKIRSTDSRSHFFSKKYMLLLENGAIVNLWKIDAGARHGSAVSFSGSDAGWSSFLLGVDSKGWASLKTSNVKKIRLPKDEYNNYDIEIEDDDADAIKKGIACIETLHISNVAYEKEPGENRPATYNNNPANTISTGSGKSDPIPALLMNKKWHSKFTITMVDKEREVESTIEYFANNEFQVETKSADYEGKPTASSNKNRFEIANGGKYILYYNNHAAPQTQEIVSLEEGVFITKDLSSGKVTVHNKL